jgi:hypothetical protein
MRRERENQDAMGDPLVHGAVITRPVNLMDSCCCIPIRKAASCRRTPKRLPPRWVITGRGIPAPCT